MYGMNRKVVPRTASETHEASLSTLDVPGDSRAVEFPSHRIRDNNPFTYAYNSAFARSLKRETTGKVP
jgi:hypothetical protein